MNKQESKEVLEEFAGKLEGIMTKPVTYPTYNRPESIKFSNHPKDISALVGLVDSLLELLDGHTIEEIATASKIVECYVTAQSKGQYFFSSSIGGV